MRKNLAIALGVVIALTYVLLKENQLNYNEGTFTIFNKFQIEFRTIDTTF